MSAHLPLSDAKFMATEVKKYNFRLGIRMRRRVPTTLRCRIAMRRRVPTTLSEMQDRDAKESTNDLEMQDRDAKGSTYTSMSNNGSQFGEEGLTQH